MRNYKLGAIFLFSILSLAACSSTPIKPVDNNASNSAAAPIEHAPQTNPVAQSNADANELNDAHSILAKRSVYFDFDKFNIKSEYDTLIQAHAKYLVNHPNQKIIIQGNTDDRGSAEYNLALGQRRSEAIRKALHLLGAPDSQMEAISFGKEKPMASGEEESAWSKNRRADIVYQQH